MDKQELKKQALQYIEDHKEELMEIGDWLYNHPEPGFREENSSAYVKKVLEGCGLSVRDHVALTGLKAKAEGKEHKANVCVMGELDSLIMPSHEKAQKDTGYFHGCGHHAQIATIIGVAYALVKSGLVKELDGDLTFIGVPAEEVIELEYRNELIKAGKISFVSGKQELIKLGEFDDVDMVFMSHIMGHTPDAKSWVGHSWNGVVNKTVQFTGRGAHAGLAPERGINALEACITSCNAINAIRERFYDEDHVRVHYIISKGGTSANVVPDDVRMEMGVRASSVEKMLEANERVERALHFGADSVGAQCETNSFGAYLPCHQNYELGQAYLDNARAIIGEENVTDSFKEFRGSSTDCGDVACLKPLIHPYFGGAVGVPHGLDFDIIDKYSAYVVPAKIAAATIIDLLADGAEKALEIKNNFVPEFKTKEEYLEYSANLLK